jgi:adenylate cyclase
VTGSNLNDPFELIIPAWRGPRYNSTLDYSMTLRKLAIGLAIAAGSFACAFFLSRTSFFTTMEWKIYDLEFRRLGNHPERASKDIVLVKIDDLSVERMAENDFGRFPWPRDTYAVLLDYLARARPKIVVFDILLIEEDKSKVGDRSGADADEEFAAATKKSGNVIHSIDVNDSGARPLASKTVVPAFHLPPTIEEHTTVQLPFPALAEGSRALGHTFFILDADGPVRRAVPFVRHDGVFYPSLAVAAAMLALNVSPQEVSMDAAGLHLGSRVIPLFDADQEYIEKVHARHILIPYKGSAYLNEQRTTTTYRSYRFWDLFLSELELRDGKKPPEVDPSIFRDKIVFVGTTAAGLHDIFPTPYGDEGAMPGIQIHASVLDGILNDSFIRRASARSSFILLSLTALAMGLTGVSLSMWWTIPAALAIGGIDAGWAGYSFQRGVWQPFVPAGLTVLIAEFSTVAYKYLIEDRAKRQIQSLFSRFVSPDVVKELIHDPSKARLGGHRREMSVLFSDIRGFTTLSEAGSPEAVIDQLNEYFSHMVELLFRHKGTLDKFVGDMIMALFNAPTNDPEHADHAVQMGLSMLRELENLNRKWAGEGRPRFDIGIGINTGDMIAGMVGSEDTLSYTVIGDNVNLGSRLESLNKEYKSHIIISEATYRKLKGTYNVSPLGSVKVKGKTHEVAIYEVHPN